MNARDGKIQIKKDKDKSQGVTDPDTKGWTLKDWENYLSILDVGIKESQLTDLNLDDKNPENIFELSAGSATSVQATRVGSALDGLTEKQRFVIQAIFWEGKSERKIATLLGASRSAVQRLKRRAIRNLKALGVDTVSVFPLVRTQDENEEGGNHE